MVRTITRSNLALGASLLLALPVTHAEVIRLDPSTLDVGIGQTFAVDLVGEGFDKGITGGGFQLDFDPAIVNITNVTINAALFEFGSRPGTWDNVAGTLRGSGFNSLFGHGLTAFEIATIEMLAVGSSSSVLDLERGPFNVVDLNGNIINADVAYGDGTVAVIPEPASGVLLAVGLLVLGSLWPCRQAHHGQATRKSQ